MINRKIDPIINFRIKINELYEIPSKTDGLEYINNNEQYDNKILNQLPIELKYLSICTKSNNIHNFQNLPINLIKLDLDCFINLDNLPENLKILKIGKGHTYRIEEFLNLPKGLEQIHTCFGDYDSVQEFMSKYYSKTKNYWFFRCLPENKR